MNISFNLTQDQVRRSFKTGSIEKDVTRRLGWKNAKAGQRLVACEKCQGLGKGGKIVKLGVIELVSVIREPLNRMLKEPAYGEVEVLREGFPFFTPADFVEFFANKNQCEEWQEITRLEFRYIIAPMKRVPLNIIEARACCACVHWHQIEGTENKGQCCRSSVPMSTGCYFTCPSFSALQVPGVTA